MWSDLISLPVGQLSLEISRVAVHSSYVPSPSSFSSHCVKVKVVPWTRSCLRMGSCSCRATCYIGSWSAHRSYSCLTAARFLGLPVALTSTTQRPLRLVERPALAERALAFLLDAERARARSAGALLEGRTTPGMRQSHFRRRFPDGARFAFGWLGSLTGSIARPFQKHNGRTHVNTLHKMKTLTSLMPRSVNVYIQCTCVYAAEWWAPCNFYM